MVVAPQITEDGDMSGSSRRADMFMDLADDPRENWPSLGHERATLMEYLRCQHHPTDLLRERIAGRVGQ